MGGIIFSPCFESGIVLTVECVLLSMGFNWNDRLCRVEGTEICCETGSGFECGSPKSFIENSVEEDGFNEFSPELSGLKDAPAGPEQYHEEGSALTHTAMVADEALERRPGDSQMFFAAVAHDLGKCKTPESEYPLHRGHDKAGVSCATKLADSMGLTGRDVDVMEEAARFHMRVFDVPDMKESTVIRMVEDLNGLSTGQLVDLAEADKLGRVPEQSMGSERVRQDLSLAEKVVNDFNKDDAFMEFDADEGNVDDIVLQERVERFKQAR